MKRKSSKSSASFGLAFMDCICCGFGAVILLLVMNKGTQQGAIEEAARVNESILRQVQDDIAEVRGETFIHNIRLDWLKEEISDEKEKLARLRELEMEALAQFAGTKDLSELVEEKKRALFKAKQLRDNLRNTPPAWKTDVVGGIPADSEYVIFIIDTSGSMSHGGRKIAVSNMLKETLEVYPKIKGFQVMDADGRYLFPGESGGWLAADHASRIRILQSFVNWRAGSGSSPFPGLIEALITYGKSGKEISIYVLGDDFGSREGIADLVNQVSLYNPVRSDGTKAVRIHTLAFPYTWNGAHSGSGLFATAMRALAEENDGAFITVNR